MTASCDQTPAEEAPNGLSRRSVVRVGAAAAWSVPVVALATSAPAHAAVSGDTPALTVSATATPQGGSPFINVSVTVTNATQVEAETLAVQVTVPLGTERLATAPTLNRTDSPWTGQGNSGVYTFQYSGSLVASSMTLTFQLRTARGNPANPAVLATVTASTTGFEDGENTFSIS